MADTTTPDVASLQWQIGSDVDRLREWATRKIHSLASLDADGDPIAIGTAATCKVRVHDGSKPRRVSREHAFLERRDEHWCIINNGSKNGLLLDGAEREKCLLVPGMEIGLGRGVTLVAENPRFAALRELLARMLGWALDRAEAVDLALRSIRLAANRRGVLVLSGDADLISLAHELHEFILPGKPFVLCHPTRSTQVARDQVRVVPLGVDALDAATGGSICLLHDEYPGDLEAMLVEARRPECCTLLVVCAKKPKGPQKLFHATPIEIPSLRRRRAELDRVIDEYVGQATSRVGMEAFELTDGERAWIRAESGKTLPDIQMAAFRLAALRHGGDLQKAGPIVGITPEGLAKWFRDKRFKKYEQLHREKH